jgi:hypothetical protein
MMKYLFPIYLVEVGRSNFWCKLQSSSVSFDPSFSTSTSLKTKQNKMYLPCCRKLWAKGHWSRLAGSNFYCAGTDPGDSSPEPREQRGLTFPCKQVTEAKSKAQPTYGCMWPHWLFHFPSAMLPSCFNSLSFISLLCHPFPLSHCQNTICLFLFCPLPLFLATLFPLWCSDPPRV